MGEEFGDSSKSMEVCDASIVVWEVICDKRVLGLDGVGCFNGLFYGGHE
jgi:hypothetical protein